MHKYFLFLIVFSGLSGADILVDISQQRLFLLDNRGDLIISYPISSSSYMVKAKSRIPIKHH